VNVQLMSEPGDWFHEDHNLQRSGRRFDGSKDFHETTRQLQKLAKQLNSLKYVLLLL